MENDDYNSGDHNEHSNINKHNNNMAKVKTFKLKYTELIGDDQERDGEMIVETKDIKYTLEQFGRNRNILKMNIKQSKQ
tara:strand:+ start:3121 stop:3357 length:237 start_codon:yes stop_codon:yes gene_type:complete